MKALMYHYVRPFNPDLPYFKNLDIEDFGKQLDYFEAEFGFVSKQDFLDGFQTGILPKGVVLTFDDGLSCHCQHVLPELQKRGLWGIFYIATAPYFNDKILDVHRIHLLLGRASADAVYAALQPLVHDEMLPGALVGAFRELPYELQQNDNSTHLVKQILNYFISYEHRTAVIDRLMDLFVPKELQQAADFYLKPSQIKVLQDAGMIVGSHTNSHPLLSRLGVSDQRDEIGQSFAFLEQTTGGLTHKTFCYPYGGFHSFNHDTEQILAEHNCLFSFNVEHRDISGSDLLQRPQALPRYDCNFFPFGQCRI